MASNSYESGRLDLPFIGHCTFAKSQPCTVWDHIDADVAVLEAYFSEAALFRYAPLIRLSVAIVSIRMAGATHATSRTGIDRARCRVR